MHFWTLTLPRGVETLTISMSNALSQQGHDVSILTAHSKRQPMVSPLPSVKVIQFPTFRYYSFLTIAPFYAANLIKEQYDVVVTFFADFGEGWAMWLSKPFFQPCHMLYLTFPYESAPHRYHSYRDWGWDQKADIILADAEYTAQGGAKFFQRSVINLPSGTDPERFKPEPELRTKIRRELNIEEGELVLLNVAALEQRKGIWRVIEALPEIRKKCGNVRYLIFGEGPQKEVLQNRAVELKVMDCVIFAGTTANLQAYYNAADIFVMLSDSEAGSIACLEAMASGLPVVVSKSGGFNEVVTLDCGRLVDIENPDDFVQAVRALNADASLRRKMGLNGRQRIIENFSWKALTERLIKIIVAAHPNLND